MTYVVERHAHVTIWANYDRKKDEVMRRSESLRFKSSRSISKSFFFIRP